MMFLYKRSELSLDILLLEPFLLEPSSYATLHLILRGDDKLCHRYLMFVTYLRSLCSSMSVRHQFKDLIYSLIWCAVTYT